MFKQLHNFSTNQVGLVFIALSIGVYFGFAATLAQERLYKRYAPTRGPEARLYTACAAAIVFPAGMFMYAWCAQSSVPWPAACVGIAVRLCCLSYTTHTHHATTGGARGTVRDLRGGVQLPCRCLRFGNSSSTYDISDPCLISRPVRVVGTRRAEPRP
jgi:hypothetical protein